MGVIQAVVADPLADRSPVFLFDMGIIFIVVSAAAGKLDGFFSFAEVAEQVVV